VLYLALEDNLNRLQDRLNKVSPICDLDNPTDIHFVTKAQKLGSGLAEQISEFLDLHQQTKLIVIDTLQYIRNNGKFTGTYSGDYQDMDALREISTSEMSGAKTRRSSLPGFRPGKRPSRTRTTPPCVLRNRICMQDAPGPAFALPSRLVGPTHGGNRHE